LRRFWESGMAAAMARTFNNV